MSRWNRFKNAASAVLGVYVTTYVCAVALNMINLAAPWGRLLTLATAVLTAYGFKAAREYQQDRTPWTTEQKQQESMRRIAAGQPPLQGFEHLLTGAPAPAVTTTTITQTTPATPTPPPPIKGA